MIVRRWQTTLDLRYPVGPARALSAETPELAIGYDEAWMMALYERSGLRVRQPIDYGS